MVCLYAAVHVAVFCFWHAPRVVLSYCTYGLYIRVYAQRVVLLVFSLRMQQLELYVPRWINLRHDTPYSAAIRLLCASGIAVSSRTMSHVQNGKDVFLRQYSP